MVHDDMRRVMPISYRGEYHEGTRWLQTQMQEHVHSHQRNNQAARPHFHVSTLKPWTPAKGFIMITSPRKRHI